MSIRTRLILLMLGLMTAVSTVLLVLFLHNELGSISGVARDRNLRVLLSMAEVCRESGGPGKSAAYRYFRSFIKTPETMTVSCVDAGGAVFLSEHYNTPYYRPSRYLPGSFRPPATGNWVTVEDNGVEILKASIETTSPGRGRVSARVDFSTQSLYQKIEESLRSSLRRFAFVLSAAFAIGCLGALIITRVVAAPIQALSAGAKMIGAGRFAHRIPVTRRDEMGRLAAEFNEMADRLARSEEMKRDLTSSITHDLRSPVTGIGLCADMVEALAAKKEHARIPEQLVSVREHLQRLNLFIDSLLEVARIDSGKAALSPRPVDLEEIADRAVRSFRPYAAARGLQLELVVGGELPDIEGDPERLYQVVSNLVGNALKFTDSGGVRVFVAAEDGGQKVRVADTGIGIPAGELGRIFEKFYRVRPGGREQPSARQGTGLGLFIAGFIAEQHGGRIEVESEPGKGSVFTFVLPAGRKDDGR
ncbi:MAG TPA: HAMP domain-containing sensor histidine kinase [Elusimicrobiales bacterium]|nr:HAMP domain-containing sensor histidine kinase [Elusimicrobiales bacterium]